jgi:hypothetical protein
MDGWAEVNGVRIGGISSARTKGGEWSIVVLVALRACWREAVRVMDGELATVGMR